MPELSRFFGIIIRMFAEPSERHHTAHFHAYYQEHIAVFSISPVVLISDRFLSGNSGWSRLGQSFTKTSCFPIGIFFKRVVDLHQSLPCSRIIL
jgi:hypothetical protein